MVDHRLSTGAAYKYRKCWKSGEISRTFERHVLDKANGNIFVLGQLDKVGYFHIVQTLDYDDVNLDSQSIFPESFRYLETLHHFVEAPTTSHKLVFEFIQCIEREVEVRQAGFDERG